MKHNLLFCLLLVFSGSLFSQTIYVKHNASGANNGTSWADAYTTVYAALTSASAGAQVWVAAGKYTPDPGVANNTFKLLAGVQLYGGFNGTETLFSARNPAANITILSGDLAGNDIAGNFTMNRTDNARHVIEVLVGANPADRAVVDGFTISGGHTLVGDPNPDLSRRGAGILAPAVLTAKNCLFTDNYGESGAGIAAIGPGGSGLLVDACIFEFNEVTAQSAGILIRELSSGTIKNSAFRDNKTNRGCIYPFLSANILIDSCLFEDNDAGVNFAAGLFTWQSDYTLSNSTFRGNKAAAAGAIYNDGRDGGNFSTINNCLFENNTVAGTGFGGAIYNWQGNYLMVNTTFRGNIAGNAAAIYNDGREFDSNFIIDSCLFEQNEATDYGGTGLYAWKSNYAMLNTVFRGNKAGNSAAAVYNGDTTIYLIKNCLFENGLTNFGAAIANYGAGNTGLIDSCAFSNNKANTSGGAMINGFTAKPLVQNCTFTGNQARFGAGIFNQNDYTAITVKSSNFIGNTADDAGGGINVASGIVFSLVDSRFELNTSNRGGAMQISEDSLDLTVATIDNCIFQDNFALTQGAGLDLNDANVTISNCLMVKNLNIGTGAGGAMINNASANKSAPVKIINSTIASNQAVLGAGIAQWEDDANGGNASVELLNTVLYNGPGMLDYQIEAGTPVVTSLGGNLCGDNTLNSVLTATNDQTGLDPQFIDPGFNDFHLKANSPCIDKGIAAGAPPLDLDGNPRKGAGPDQGCYEFQTSATHLPGAGVLPLRLMPNPAAERAVLVLENEWAGDVQLRIVGQNGALLASLAAFKTAGRWVQVLDVQALPAGIYSVQVLSDAIFAEGSLVKQ